MLTTTECPVRLTEGAVEELKNIRKANNIPADHGLRIGVKGGGCSGFSYILGFDEIHEEDEVYQLDSFQVFIQKSHAMYLIGMEIEYVDGLNNRGFSFNNPNATETCGCGTSFSAEGE